MRGLFGKLLAAAVAGGIGLGAIAWSLERRSAYRSPLRELAPRGTPRDQAFVDLAEAAEARRVAAAERAALLANLTTETMVELGREIVHGRGLCFNCHAIGREGSGAQGPNLAGIGFLAGQRVDGLSAVDYLAQSLYQPEAYVVDGYSPTMTAADEPPIGLDADEILMVIAYLETLGGAATVEPGQSFGPEVTG